MANIIELYKNLTTPGAKFKVSDLTGSNTIEELTELSKRQNKYISSVDYSDPKNFARFGSAEEYYKNCINYIDTDYPYDGSTYSKNFWVNSLNEFEFFVFSNQFPRSVGHIALSQSQSIEVLSHIKEPDEDIKAAYEYKKYTDNTKINFNNGVCFESWLKFDSNVLSNVVTMQALSASNPTTFSALNIFSIYKFGNNFHIFDSFNNFTTLNTSIPNNEWHHYSFNLKTGSLQLFKDGVLTEEAALTNINLLTSSYTFTKIGLMYQDLNSINYTSSTIKQPVFLLGSGSKCYYDDTRMWNNSRTVEQVGRNWFTNVNGNDPENLEINNLLFYYKFNEGWDQQYQSFCVDYSGRKNDTSIKNFENSCRLSGSAFDISGLVQDVEKPEIIPSGMSYSTAVKNFYDEKIDLGKRHDEENMHLLYNKFPGWVLEEEEEFNKKHLKQIIQIVSSYFDDLYNKIGEMTEYKKVQHTTDLSKIYPFYDKILASTGFDTAELFNNISQLEKLSSRTDQTLFDENIQKIKNAIFQSIYSNLSYILKSKGTEKSLRSFFRSYGISDDLVRINLYADKSVYGVTDRSRQTVVKKKTVTMTGSNSVFLASSSLPEDHYLTLETSVIFSKNLKLLAPVSSSIIGFNNATGSYYVTLEHDSKDVSKFALNLSSSLGITREVYSFSSSNLYDDTNWNICLRKKADIFTMTGTTGSYNYILELYGVNLETHPPVEFTISSSYPSYTGSLQHFIGANKTNLSGSTICGANSKFLYCNFWSDYLNNDVIKSHNKDILNYGVDN